MNKIFISYSRQDGAEDAEYLHTLLAGAGYSVWKDDHALKTGETFPQAITDSIQKADSFILLVSKAALKSSWVEFEIKTAQASGKTPIPLIVNNVPIPPELTDIHCLDIGDKSNRWKAINKLVNELPGGTKIPRVYNMSGHANISVEGLVILGHSNFKYADLGSPESIEKNAKELALTALPFLKLDNTGFVPHGHPALAAATLACLLGLLNQMPPMYWTQRIGDEKFGISKNHRVSLQNVRDYGFSHRHQHS